MQQMNGLLFVGLMNVIALFPSERNMYYRERADGTYSTLPFFLSYVITEIPFEAVFSMVFVLFTTLAAGFEMTVTNFFVYSYVAFALMNVGETVGMAVCAVVYEPDVSVTITNVILGVFVNMVGLMAPTQPQTISYINYASVLK